MKIAIVRGGFAGIAAQLRAWRLEKESEAMMRAIERDQREIEARCARLALLRDEAIRAAAIAKEYQQ